MVGSLAQSEWCSLFILCAADYLILQEALHDDASLIFQIAIHH